MAHFITDAEGKLHKIAGNFNPSYEVSQLVAEKTITTPTNLITIDNLDIKADGGVYDFVLSGCNTSYQENIIKFQIGYNNAAFSSNRYYHQFMASYDSTVYAGTSKSSGYSTIGVFAQNPSSITGSISLFENFAQGKTQSFDVQNSNQILICGFGYYDAVPNITELYFVIDTTFAVGTTVKVYKRMANAMVSNEPTNMSLLWINPSPSSAFAGQVVSVDLKEYDLALIIFKWDASSTDTGSMIVPKGWAGYVGAPYTLANRYQRSIGAVNETNINFGDGVVGSGFNNIACCPLYIYGIKVG